MNLVALVNYGTPVILLGVLIFLAIVGVRLKNVEETIKNMKESIVWSDTFAEFRLNIDGRLKRLESAINNR